MEGDLRGMAYRITLDFEDRDTLRQALDYIGDIDAPVMITAGTVEYDGTVARLWDGWEAAMDNLAEVEA